jgi:hypothetical protein
MVTCTTGSGDDSAGWVEASADLCGIPVCAELASLTDALTVIAPAVPDAGLTAGIVFS